MIGSLLLLLLKSLSKSILSLEVESRWDQLVIVRPKKQPQYSSDNFFNTAVTDASLTTCQTVVMTLRDPERNLRIFFLRAWEALILTKAFG